MRSPSLVCVVIQDSGIAVGSNLKGFAEEQERIEEWLALAAQLATSDNELAIEWVRCQRLIKGYGDTFERGLRNFATVRDAFLALPQEARTARWLAQARDAALGDDKGERLDGFLRAA